MCYIQALILKCRDEEMYVLILKTRCLYAAKYKICNPLMFLLKDKQVTF